MINITDKSQCCGCTACASICSHHAITMHPDDLGFLYPVVNREKCVDCGMCNKVCAFNEQYDKEHNLFEPEVYAVRHKDMNEVETSRSGAAFIALSDWILEQGGVVYGAGYGEHFRVIHKRATTKEERDEFKGSKYVQSDLNTIFVQIKKDLKRSLYVLFSGTPCQTSGLQSYLKELRVNVEKLFIIDLVCHGVPAPYIWRDYLAYIERKMNEKAVSVSFRNKSRAGWNSYLETFTFLNKTIVRTTYRDLFYSNIMLRSSCGLCPFTNFVRPSDLTIGDFWGWEKLNSNINADNKGVSLLLVNTRKGKFLFERVRDNFIHVKTDIEHCVQPNLQNPSIISPLRDKFEKDYIEKGFVYCGKKYGDMGLKYVIIDILRTIKHKLFF